MSQEVSEFDFCRSAVYEHAAKCDVHCEGRIVEAVSNEGAFGSVNATAALFDKVPSNGESDWEDKGKA